MRTALIAAAAALVALLAGAYAAAEWNRQWDFGAYPAQAVCYRVAVEHYGARYPEAREHCGVEVRRHAEINDIRLSERLFPDTTE